MTYAQKKEIIVKFLTGKDFVSPTEIGHLFGGHSAVGSPLCLKMTKENILERSEKGHYRLKNVPSQ